MAEGQAAQPNAFDPRIEAEAKAGSSSAIWEKQFAVSLAGDSISVPYPLVDVTGSRAPRGSGRGPTSTW